MNESTPLELTDLQRRILHAKASDLDASTVVIADRLDCSSSYVREILSKHGKKLEQVQEMSTWQYMPSFGYPYSILVHEETPEQHYLSVGDVLELTFEVDEEERTTYGKVELHKNGMLSGPSAEMQARAYGSYYTTIDLQDSGIDTFDQFDTLSDGRADLSTAGEFGSFLQTIDDQIHNQIETGIDLLIGVGILEIVHGERNPTDLIWSPHFILERGHFPTYIANDGPELVDVKLYSGPVSEPENVYFTYYGESLNESQEQDLREQILEYEIFKSAWNYSLPGYSGVVGPTTTEMTDKVVRVTDESLQVVEGVTRSVRFYEDASESVFSELDAESIHDAILEANLEFEWPATHTRFSGEVEQLPLRKNGEDIYFLFDQVTLVLSAEGDHITWQSPAGIEPIKAIIGAVNHIIQDQFGLHDYEMASPRGPRRPRFEQEEWTFDTNALYHDHAANLPTSVLHTIFPRRYFYDSTIHIPWAVLFEMNKHPESGSASEAANKQGFENLEILRMLEQLEWLSVVVQTPPEQIEVDLGNGDVADMQILAYADSHDAQLVSGDRSLIDIARLSDTPSVDIAQLNSLSIPIKDDSILEEVLRRIGADLHSESEILKKLEDTIDKGATIPEAETSNPSMDDPESILQSWKSEKQLLPYTRSTDGERCYAPCEDVTIVPTSSVIEFLPTFLDDSQRYFTDELLHQLSDNIDTIHSNEVPSITFIVPAEYVIERAVPEQVPSDFNRQLLKIAAARNIEYESEPAVQSEMAIPIEKPTAGDDDVLLSWQDYLALCVTTNYESAYLMLVDANEGLWKFSKLLGINTVTLPSIDEDCSVSN